MYIFQHAPTQQNAGMPLHDHRDNLPQNGGFSFSVFHPGTGLPQQPFSV